MIIVINIVVVVVVVGVVVVGVVVVVVVVVEAANADVAAVPADVVGFLPNSEERPAGIPGSFSPPVGASRPVCWCGRSTGDRPLPGFGWPRVRSETEGTHNRRCESAKRRAGWSATPMEG